MDNGQTSPKAAGNPQVAKHAQNYLKERFYVVCHMGYEMI
jgi:hypothetical protein